MKYRCLLICFCFLLLTVACSKEEDIWNGNSIQTFSFEIEIPTSQASAGGTPTRAKGPYDPDGPTLPGECIVDEVKILVFKSTENHNDAVLLPINTFQYVTDGTVTTQPYRKAGDNNWYAKGKFAAESGATYRVIALAYRKTDYDSYLEHSITTGTTLPQATIRIKQLTGGDYSHHTPEFFKGELRIKDGTTDEITGDGDLLLTGSLYRATGRATVTINGIPDDVESLDLIMDKYTTESYLHHEVLKNYIGLPKTVNEERLKVASTATITNGSATLSADLLQLSTSSSDAGNNGSLYYIDVKRTGGTTTHYLVRAADYYIEDESIGIKEYVIVSSRINVPTNWQVNITGDFTTLTTGTLKVDCSEITDEHYGGILIP